MTNLQKVLALRLSPGMAEKMAAARARLRVLRVLADSDAAEDRRIASLSFDELIAELRDFVEQAVRAK